MRLSIARFALLASFGSIATCFNEWNGDWDGSQEVTIPITSPSIKLTWQNLTSDSISIALKAHNNEVSFEYTVATDIPNTGEFTWALDNVTDFSFGIYSENTFTLSWGITSDQSSTSDYFSFIDSTTQSTVTRAAGTTSNIFGGTASATPALSNDGSSSANSGPTSTSPGSSNGAAAAATATTFTFTSTFISTIPTGGSTRFSTSRRTITSTSALTAQSVTGGSSSSTGPASATPITKAKKSNTGIIAGVVVAVVVVALILLGGCFLWRRKKTKKTRADAGVGAGGPAELESGQVEKKQTVPIMKAVEMGESQQTASAQELPANEPARFNKGIVAAEVDGVGQEQKLALPSYIEQNNSYQPTGVEAVHGVANHENEEIAIVPGKKDVGAGVSEHSAKPAIYETMVAEGK